MAGKRARVVVCGGEKGGTGKTMLAVHAAVWLMARGKRVLLLDEDPQQSAARWALGRDAIGITPQVPCAVSGSVAESAGAAIMECAPHYDVLIVDVGGADSSDFHQALALCDVLLCPTTAGDSDLATLEMANLHVGYERRKGHRLKAHVVFNLCSNDGGAEVRDGLREIAGLTELSPAQRTIRFRKGFRLAYLRRLTMAEAAEGKPRVDSQRRYADGAAEVDALFSEVLS